MIQYSWTPDGQVVAPLFFVIPHPVSLPLRDELDRDRGDILVRVGYTAQANPDRRDRRGDGCPEGGCTAPTGSCRAPSPRMIQLVRPEKETELVIGISFRFSGRWAHDQYSMDQFVAVKLVEVVGRVELLGRHQHAVGGGAQPGLPRPANAGGAHGSDLSSNHESRASRSARLSSVILPRGDVRARGLAVDPLEQPGEDAAGADLVEGVEAVGEHPPHRLFPADALEHLGDERAADVVGVGVGPASTFE